MADKEEQRKRQIREFIILVVYNSLIMVQRYTLKLYSQINIFETNCISTARFFSVTFADWLFLNGTDIPQQSEHVIKRKLS